MASARAVAARVSALLGKDQMIARLGGDEFAVLMPNLTDPSAAGRLAERILDALAAKDDDVTSFFLTDFLARQFRAFVIEPLGLDRHPQLKGMYFGNYTKVVYLSQIEDEGLQQKAKEAADYLGLAYEYRFTGYGDLTGELLKAR